MESFFGDIAVTHALELNINRPPRPRIISVEPMSALAGRRVVINGEHLRGARHVRFSQAEARIELATDSRVAVEVPAPLPRPFEDAPLTVETAGGESESPPIHRHFRIHRKPHGVRCLQNLVRSGNVVEVEGVDLTGVTNVEFVADASQGPVFDILDPGSAPSEEDVPFDGTTGDLFILGKSGVITWREVVERGTDNQIVRELLVVSVPDGLPSKVQVRVTTQAGSATTAAITVISGPPVIQSVAVKQGSQPSPNVGRQRVVVRGQNLNFSPKVLFGGRPATGVTAVTRAHIEFDPPPGIRRGHVVVHTDHGSTITKSELRLGSGPLQ